MFLFCCQCVCVKTSVCIEGHNAHSIGMTNNSYMDNDHFLSSSSELNTKMMKRADQLSARTGQWECVDAARGGVENDWRALWPIGTLYFEKKSNVRGNNKSPRLHLNARDVSQHKSKMSAGWSEAVRLRLCAYLEKKLPFFSPPGSRPKLTTN